MSHNAIPSSNSSPTRAVRFEVILTVAVVGVLLIFMVSVIASRWTNRSKESPANLQGSVQPISMSLPVNSMSLPVNGISESRSRATSDPMQELTKIAFVRDDTVFLYDLQTKTTKRIAEGYYPDISPDGDNVTFTVNLDDLHTTIKSFDLGTQTISTLRSIEGLNARDARWSHDGRRLAFYVVDDRRGQIGVVDLLTGQSEVITKAFPFRDHGLFRGGVYFSSWSPDDKSIICHDMYAMYEIALDGRILNRIPFEKIIPGVEVTSALRFEFSADRDSLLIDGSANPEHSNIYIFNFQDQKLRRVTTDAVDGFEPRWLPSQDAILFTRNIRVGSDVRSDLCALSLKDATVTTIIANAECGAYATR